MGKDNIVFHSVIWPAMLLGYDAGGELGAGRGDLHLPTNVVASEYLTMEGKKASTSRNLAIWVARLPRAATTRIRCATTSPPPAPRRRTPTSRGTSSSAATTTSCSRTGATSSTARSSARTATSARCRSRASSPTPTRRVLDAVAAAFDEVGGLIEQARFRAAIAEAMRVSSLANQYVADQAPWALVKTDRDRAATVLYVALPLRRLAEDAVRAVPPVHVADGARAARLRRLARRSARVPPRSPRRTARRTTC